MPLYNSNLQIQINKDVIYKMVRGIYVITDTCLVPGRSHIDVAGAALNGGASIIQLRDKSKDDDELIKIGYEIRRLTFAAGALFIINDRLEVALACDADGLHVGQEDRSASELRLMLPGKLLGVSVATPEEAARAQRDGADYLGVGPVFETSTKIDAGLPVGIHRIELARSASGGLPIVAIGGINEGNIAEVARTGADSAAVISAIVCADDMTEATRRLVQIWKNAKSEYQPPTTNH